MNLQQQFDQLAVDPRFHRMALRLGLSWHDAEDVVQEAMLKAHRYLPRFEGRSQLSSWIMRILINEVNMLRRSPRVWDSDHLAPIEDKFHSPTPSPERTVLSRYALRRTLAAVDIHLTRSQRYAVLSRIHEGTAEVAGRAVGISRGTIRAHMSRGRSQLRSALGQ